MSDTEGVSGKASVLINNECTNTPIGLTKSASSSDCDRDTEPRILCDELLIKPCKSKSVEKLDELSSLEREIAKMHDLDDMHMNLEVSSCTRTEEEKNQMQATETIASNTPEIYGKDESSASDIQGCQIPHTEEKLDAINSGATALEHEDLIAVLKGLDGNSDEMHNSAPASIMEGVTIEGEGEYQIMEVIDEDSNTAEEATKQSDSSASMAESVVRSLNKTKTFGSTALTAQEERALALEQIEGLKITHRSRKQDIKNPIKQADSALDLVSSLEAEWSENEEDLSEAAKTEIKKKASANKNRTVITKACDNKINTPLITSIVVIPSGAAATSSNTSIQTNITPAIAKISSNNSNKSDETKLSTSTEDKVIETKSSENTQIPSQSGFRRTRIIKRKIIWDPDAPETTFSYAKLVKSNSNKTKNEQILTTTIRKGSTTITPIKKETNAPASNTTRKMQRPTTPKSKNSATDLNIENTNSMKSTNSGLPQNITEKEVTKTINKTEDHHAKAVPNIEMKSLTTTTTSPTKRRSQTPVSNGSSCGASVKKKKITEVDRLMGDEGAVNMLNSLEKLEATLGPSETKSTRPMMRSRAATICEKIPRKDTSPIGSTTTTSPTSTNVQMNKGKRTPKPRASSSWDYVYKKKKKQDFDDSLIIRRRSNSSYSSTTSLNRLSLDGPPASISNNNTSNISSKKSNDSTSLPASINENDSSKTSPSTSNHNKSSSSSKSRSTPTQSPNKTFEFAKPESKKSQKYTKTPAATLTTDMKKAAPVTGKRNVRSPATANDEKSKDVKSSSKSPVIMKDKRDTASSSNTISDVMVKKSSKVAQILFSTNKAKLSNTFTIQMLQKLVDILDKLAADSDCHVVVIGTSDAHFCQGVDITDLTTIAAEKRKHFAVNLATSVKNYLKTLATFPKPIIGGVSGNVMNLGVIQLAFFDIVIASDKSTFEMAYCKMGQTPEGYCIWHNTNKIRGSFKTKLFWLGEKVQSTEAALAGLVNKLTIANKVNDDALLTAKRIASLSTESYRVMKKTVINSHLDVIDNSLDDEFNTIIKQWTTSECLENIKKYIGRD